MEIVARTPLQAWAQALATIQSEGEQVGMVTRIEEARMMGLGEMALFDAKALDPRQASVFTTADVIFPEWPRNGSLEGFFKHNPAAGYSEKVMDTVTWGCYFEQLTKEDHGPNQILHAIKCLKTWGRKTRSVFTFHTTHMGMHKPQPQGNPCLQYLALVRNDEGKLDLMMAYRAHEYFGRALGNWVGASRMLEFICHHSGHEAGGIVCLAGRAYATGTKSDQRKLLTLAQEKIS